MRKGLQDASRSGRLCCVLLLIAGLASGSFSLAQEQSPSDLLSRASRNFSDTVVEGERARDAVRQFDRAVLYQGSGQEGLIPLKERSQELEQGLIGFSEQYNYLYPVVMGIPRNGERKPLTDEQEALKKDAEALRAIFGEEAVAYADGKFEWRGPKADGGLERPFGKGTAYLVLPRLKGDRSSPAAVHFYGLIDAVAPREASCEPEGFKLVVRAADDGTRYVTVFNLSATETREATCIVRGEFARGFDLAVGSGFPIVLQAEGGTTRFPVRLAPGEGTLIRLDMGS